MKIDDLKAKIEKVLNDIGLEKKVDIIFETPNNPEHGDISCNIAMQLASDLKKPPRDIANDIISKLEYDKNSIDEVTVAGPGFINFKFSKSFYQDQLDKIVKEGENFGRQEVGKGTSVNIEYVSANPTGLLHLGHGRNAAIGDTLANVFDWLGYDVTREYYFNNAGNQMNKLVESIYSRYKQLLGEKDFPFPEDGYHGEYIKQIAKELHEEYGEDLKEGTFQDNKRIKKFGEGWCFDKIKKTLERMNIHQDVYFNEDSLYKEGKIKEVIDELRTRGLVYEKDGATWLKFSELGLDDDRVIVKSSGEPTYRLPDIAYHSDKFKRGYDRLIDVLGADHIATVPDVLAGVKALGYDTDAVEILIHQFVTLTEDGKQIKMSKRTGKSFTLDDLLDEAGAEVVRFFLIMRGVSTHLEFDLSLAKEQSDKNPVFYLKYAHARICSIFEKIEDSEDILKKAPNFDLLEHEAEIDLIKMLLKFPETIEVTAEKYEPHILVEYLRNTASKFSTFYHSCRIKGEEDELVIARCKLAEATRTVIKNGLQILGISAPEKM